MWSCCIFSLLWLTTHAQVLTEEAQGPPVSEEGSPKWGAFGSSKALAHHWGAGEMAASLWWIAITVTQPSEWCCKHGGRWLETSLPTAVLQNPSPRDLRIWNVLQGVGSLARCRCRQKVWMCCHLNLETHENYQPPMYASVFVSHLTCPSGWTEGIGWNVVVCSARLLSQDGVPSSTSPEVCVCSQHRHFLLGFHGLELLPCVLFMPRFNELFFHD